MFGIKFKESCNKKNQSSYMSLVEEIGRQIDVSTEDVIINEHPNQGDGPLFDMSEEKVVIPVGTSETLGWDFNNTVCHELTHAKNFKSIRSEEIKSRLKDPNDLSIGKVGYKLIDEYLAYEVANKLYPEGADVLKSDGNKLQEVMGVIIKTDVNVFIHNNGGKQITCSRIFDFFSAIIANHILRDAGKLPKNFRKAMETIIQKAGIPIENMSWSDFESVGNSFIDELIKNLDYTRKKEFKEKTCIDFNE